MNSQRSVTDRLISKPTHASDAASIYHTLLSRPQEAALPVVRDFLDSQLMLAKQHTDAAELPDDLSNWAAWIEDNAKQVASTYRVYLEGRRAGRGRAFFTTKAHALYFLQHVAPTKLVDGAWLYDAVNHAGDWRYHKLIRTYLEELGDGDPAMNHVVLYRKLLADHDCAPSEVLDQEHYVQGAIQLALGYAGADYLPEVLGYNLGYEQLPLHLLITAFELNELGIDPYYFTLHVTIDNASTGHAHKAIQAAIDLMPTDDSREEFIARIRTGYLLNELGKGTKAVISSFDLEQEVVTMLERKRSFGQHMHSDYCRLDGLTVNEWLSEPGQCRAFLTVLENKGWIKRHQDPVNSRFWQLIDGPGAVMFGVFSGYEMQLLRDWIAGEWQPEEVQSTWNPFRALFRRRPAQVTCLPATDASITAEQMTTLLSPALHSTSQGLNATRLFSRQLAEGIVSR